MKGWVAVPSVLIAIVLCAFISYVEAQAPRKVPRIGYMTPNSASANLLTRTAFREALREHGFVEGETINVEWRFGDGDVERLPRLAVELVNLNVDLILATTTQGAISAKSATATIPNCLHRRVRSHS